jgi:hypothetical protein
VAAILEVEESKMSGFLDKLPAGSARNITVNGTVRDGGGQLFPSRGTLGTGRTSENLGSGPSNTNRTGEGTRANVPNAPSTPVSGGKG